MKSEVLSKISPEFNKALAIMKKNKANKNRTLIFAITNEVLQELIKEGTAVKEGMDYYFIGEDSLKILLKVEDKQ